MLYRLRERLNATENTVKPANKSRLALTITVFWVALLLFGLLANAVRGDKPLPGDVTILHAIHSIGFSSLDRFMVYFTDLASPVAAVAIVAVAASLLAYKGFKQPAIFIFVAAGGTSAINVIFKHIFRRDRPELWHHLINETSFSFPSGHAMISSTLALCLIVLCWRSRFRLAAVLVGSLYFLAIGFSRLYLGVHYPSDVLAGWTVSTFWVCALIFAFSRLGWSYSISNPTSGWLTRSISK